VRAATLEVSARAYVEAATARGERLPVVLAREILPNITTVLLADVGIRFAGTVLLGAALSYVGLGVAPPAADWALMVSENRDGLSSNPWVVLVPAALIVCLTLAGNLVADGIAKRRSP
jgi:ABC-type dipeptide/oligopeptide/nickel transport system permease subunit